MELHFTISSFQFKKTTSFLIPFTVWFVLNNSLRIFRVVVYCLIIKVLCFCLSLTSQLPYNIIQCLSLSRTFFKFFKKFFFRFFRYYIYLISSDILLYLATRQNGEGGIWTLAPLLTTYSLSRGAPSASLGTSPCQSEKKILLTQNFFSSGEGGIRTHVPSRTNGFQDRLVMTTSIPLHIFNYVVLFATKCILAYKGFLVNNNFEVFYFFLSKNILAISRSSGVVIFILE